MLRRITIDQVHGLVPFAVFLFTFLVFIFIFYRALRMKPDNADRLAALPLDDHEAGADAPGPEAGDAPRSKTP